MRETQQTASAALEIMRTLIFHVPRSAYSISDQGNLHFSANVPTGQALHAHVTPNGTIFAVLSETGRPDRELEDPSIELIINLITGREKP